MAPTATVLARHGTPRRQSYFAYPGYTCQVTGKVATACTSSAGPRECFFLGAARSVLARRRANTRRPRLITTATTRMHAGASVSQFLSDLKRAYDFKKLAQELGLVCQTPQTSDYVTLFAPCLPQDTQVGVGASRGLLLATDRQRMRQPAMRRTLCVRASRSASQQEKRRCSDCHHSCRSRPRPARAGR